MSTDYAWEDIASRPLTDPEPTRGSIDEHGSESFRELRSGTSSSRKSSQALDDDDDIAHAMGSRSQPPPRDRVLLTPSDLANVTSQNNILATMHANRALAASAGSERKRQHGNRLGKLSAEERTGFVRIYYKNQSLTSSIAVKVSATTTVYEVRRSVANKMNIDPADFSYYVIVVVFPGDTARSVSARTLQDDEAMLPLMEKFSRARTNAQETDDALAALRTKAKHRPRSSLRFILKDVRVAKLDLEDERGNKEAPENQGLNVPAFLGKGVRSGYLQKASVKDPNIWRRRWFVVKGDQLLYCKSETNQRDVTTISLLHAYIGKARPDVRVPFAFELVTPRRNFQLCAGSKEDMLAWMDALHVQIEIAPENHRLYEAEIIITEAAIERSEEEICSPSVEPSLLQRVLSREDTHKCFRDFAYSIGAQPLLDTWIECDLFRRNCLEREAGAAMHHEIRRTAKQEWDHLRSIVQHASTLPMINQDEVAHLKQYLETDQLNRRLSLALHSDGFAEYPHIELISKLRQQIFKALESGPFRQFLMGRGYRVLLERVMGRIA